MKRIENYSLLAAAALAFTLASCSNNEIETIPYEGPVEAQINAGIDGAITRAYDTSWDKGDAIGISCSGTNTNYTNMKYVTTNGNGTFAHDGGSASGIFFQGTEEVTFSAYYPFTGSENTKPGTEGVISGSTSAQSTNQKNIDYMYAGGVTAKYSSPTVSFSGTGTKFKHMMTRLILVLETSTDYGFTADEVKNGTYTLGGLKHEGTFNMTTGEAKATSTATAVDNWSVSTNCPSADADNKRTYTMILYPQTVSGALPFTATINGNEYKNDKDITFTSNTLQAGTSYTFSITVKKTGLIVNSCTIEGWGTENTGSGDATMK